MPVSMSPTTIDRFPVPRSQASGASMSASGVPPVCPVLLRLYMFGYDGSFGVAVVR